MYHIYEFFVTHLDFKNVQQELAMVVYKFDHREHEGRLLKPDRNSQRNQVTMHET